MNAHTEWLRNQNNNNNNNNDKHKTTGKKNNKSTANSMDHAYFWSNQ